MLRSIILFCLLGITIYSCTSEKAAEPKPIVIVDTIFFAKDIQPILTTRCYMGSDGDNFCHGESGSPSRKFTTYEGFTKPYFIERMKDAINHNSGALAMPWPVGSAKIPDAEIKKIENWIAQGKINN